MFIFVHINLVYVHKHSLCHFCANGVPYTQGTVIDAFSGNGFTVGYMFLENRYKVGGYTFWKNWYKEWVCFCEFLKLRRYVPVENLIK